MISVEFTGRHGCRRHGFGYGRVRRAGPPRELFVQSAQVLRDLNDHAWRHHITGRLFKSTSPGEYSRSSGSRLKLQIATVPTSTSGRSRSRSTCRTMLCGPPHVPAPAGHGSRMLAPQVVICSASTVARPLLRSWRSGIGLDSFARGRQGPHAVDAGAVTPAKLSNTPRSSSEGGEVCGGRCVRRGRWRPVYAEAVQIGREEGRCQRVDLGISERPHRHDRGPGR